MDEQIQINTPHEDNTKKRIIIISVAILAVILVVFLIYLFLTRPKPIPVPGNQAATGPGAAEKANQDFVAAVSKAALTDKDLDGLSDADEAKYGTDPNKADTDGDGLLDRDEIFIYKTNPLKLDTYGIGNSDGWGVRRGIILPGGKRK